jgi:hypothetical protein
MEIDYKVTTWCKLRFDGDIKKEDIIKKLEEGYLPLDIGYNGIIPGLENCEWEAINDTEDYLPPEKNDGYSTIELIDEDGDIIWDNSIK